ncbi:MAG: Kelch repeat-containing protein [Thermoplasmata archaeon]
MVGPEVTVLRTGEFKGTRLARSEVSTDRFAATGCPPARGSVPRCFARKETLPATRALADITDRRGTLWDRFSVRITPTVVAFRDGEDVARIEPNHASVNAPRRAPRRPNPTSRSRVWAGATMLVAAFLGTEDGPRRRAPRMAPPRAGPRRAQKPPLPAMGWVLIVGVACLMAIPSITIGASAPRAPAPRSEAGGTANVPSLPSAAPSAVPSLGPLAYSLSHAMSWVALPPAAPVTVQGAGFAALSSNSEGVLFGGSNVSGLQDGSYLYSETSNQWTDLAPATSPSARTGFAFATDAASSTAVLFGGEVNSGSGTTTNDTWLFSFSAGSWTNVSRAVAPDARQDPAFAVGDGIALLYGGSSTASGGTGTTTYSDTWSLDLATNVWTRILPTGGVLPGPLHGASLVWQPSRNAFLLFGGCYPCSNALWAFTPSNDTWTAVSGYGEVPTVRMEAVWVWDPAQAVDLLFGGTNGTGALNDTYLYSPGEGLWTRALGSPTPSPRYGAAADFFDVAGNDTLLLAGGGNGTTIDADSWRLAATANLTVEVTNASTGYAVSGASVAVGPSLVLATNSSGGASVSALTAQETSVTVSQPGYLSQSQTLWLAPGLTTTLDFPLDWVFPAQVRLYVRTALGAPVAGAFVNLTDGRHLLPGSPHVTNGTGFTEFLGVPAANGSVTAMATGFHENTTAADFASSQVTWANITLIPLLSLTVRTLGKLPNGTTATLQNVQIDVGGLPVGRSGPGGWFNTTVDATGVVSISAGAYGYKNLSQTFLAPLSGVKQLNLTLTAYPFPSVTVEVIGRSSGSIQVLLRNASVNVTSDQVLPTGRYFGNFSTGIHGTVDFSPPPGNFTIDASSPGYLENNSGPVLNATSGAQLVRTIYLTPIELATLDVRVVSAVGGNPPIVGAAIALNISGLNLTNGLPFPIVHGATGTNGWANFSNVPGTSIVIIASAAGYSTNSTGLALSPNQRTAVAVVYLHPLPLPTYEGLRILPTASADLWVLALLPLAALAGVLVYLTMLRAPSYRDERGDESPPAGASKSAPTKPEVPQAGSP